MTLSVAAVQVITGVPLIPLLVEERFHLYYLEDANDKEVEKERKVKWQEARERHIETVAWTKVFKPDLRS